MSGIILKVPIFVVLFALLNPSNASGQNWTLDDIDDWISELETAASLASSTGDNTCREILLAAGAGYRRVNGVSWNNELIRSRRWNGVYYPILTQIGLKLTKIATTSIELSFTRAFTRVANTQFQRYTACNLKFSLARTSTFEFKG